MLAAAASPSDKFYALIFGRAWRVACGCLAAWAVAHTDGQDATEGEVVELFPPQDADTVGKEPTLLYTIRAASCTRAESISTDGGMSWSKAVVAPSPMNVDPGVVQHYILFLNLDGS